MTVAVCQGRLKLGRVKGTRVKIKYLFKLKVESVQLVFIQLVFDDNTI